MGGLVSEVDPRAPLVKLQNPSLVNFLDKVQLVNSGNKMEASCQSRLSSSWTKASLKRSFWSGTDDDAFFIHSTLEFK